jgi:hypothetical protein
MCPAAQVVVGVVDPNPLVGGAGIKILTNAGIEVSTGSACPACWRAQASEPPNPRSCRCPACCSLTQDSRQHVSAGMVSHASGL